MPPMIVGRADQRELKKKVKLFKLYSCILNLAPEGVVDSLRETPYHEQPSFLFEHELNSRSFYANGILHCFL